jgi:anti-anti-sigma regulatory factor
VTSISTMTSPTRRVVVLAPHGDLSVSDAAGLRQAFAAATSDAALVVVDLLDVPSLDDAIVEVMVGAGARCDAKGVRFVVANADEQPWIALTRARMAGVLRLHRRGGEPLAELLQLLEL